MNDCRLSGSFVECYSEYRVFAAAALASYNDVGEVLIS